MLKRLKACHSVDTLFFYLHLFTSKYIVTTQQIHISTKRYILARLYLQKDKL